MAPGEVDVRVKVLDIVIRELLRPDKLGDGLPLLVHRVEVVDIKVKIIIRIKWRTVVTVISIN